MLAKAHRWFYTDRVDASRLRLHAVERVRRVAAAFGAIIDEPHFDLAIRPDDRLWAQISQAVTDAEDHPKFGCAGDQALAARAFRGDRPASFRPVWPA